MGFSFGRQSLSSRGAGTPTAIPNGSLVVDKTSVLLAAFAGDESQTFTDADDTFTLSNGGPGNWSNPGYSIAYSDATGWLSFVPVVTSGTLYFEPIVDATALVESTQVATVTFTAGRVTNSGAVSVTITLFVAASTPLIHLSSGTLNFPIVNGTEFGTPKTVLVSNGASHGVLALPTIGTITGTGAAYINDAVPTDNGDGTYTVTVTPTSLGGSAGTYTADIPVYASGAGNSPQSITATIVVTAAQQAFIQLDRSLDDASADVGGPNPGQISVGVSSGNAVPLAGAQAAVVGYVGAHSGWLSVSVVGGTVRSTLNTQAITTGGITEAQVDVTDANAASAQRYVVRLNMGAATASPSVVLSPTGVSRAVAEGSNVATVTVAVSASGGTLASLGAITVAFTTTVTWCTPTYSAGTITLVFATTALPQGTTSAVLRVTAQFAGNSPYDMPIEVVVSAVSGSYAAIPWTIPAGASHNTSTDDVTYDPFSSPADPTGFA